MATAGVKFGFYDLSSDSNITIETFEPNGGVRIDEFLNARRDGSIFAEPKLESIRMNVRGNVIGSTAEARRTNFDAFLAKLLKRKDELYLYDDRYVKDAIVKDWSFEHTAALKHSRFTLTFVAGDPFWEALAATRDSQTISADPTQYAILLSGNAYVKPTIRILANQATDVEGFTLENLITQEKFSYAGTISTGDELVINCDTLTVENAGVNDIANFSGWYPRLLSPDLLLKESGWTVEYNAANYEPDNASEENNWGKVANGTYSETREADADCTNGYRLNLHTSNATGAHNVYYRHYQSGDPWYDHVSNPYGYDIEFRLKCIDSGGSGGHYLSISDGTYAYIIVIRASDVFIDTSDTNYSISNTDRYHTHLLKVRGTALRWYIDGHLRLTKTLSSTSSSKNLAWGDISTADHWGGQFYWDYIRYRLHKNAIRYSGDDCQIMFDYNERWF